MCSLEQKALQQVQAVVQAALALGAYDLANPKEHELLVVYWEVVWSVWQALTGESQERPLGFGSNALPSLQTTLLPLRDSS